MTQASSPAQVRMSPTASILIYLRHKGHLQEMALEVSRKKRIGLLGLPAELRNVIYEYVLIEEHTIHIKCSTKPRPVNRSATIDLCDIVIPSLARASHQLRTESLSVYLDINPFRYEASRKPTAFTHSARIGSFTTLIKKVEIKKVMGRSRWISFALDFTTGERTPKVTIDLSRCSTAWRDHSTETEKSIESQIWEA